MEWYHWLLLGWLGGIGTMAAIVTATIVVAVLEKPRWRKS